MANSRIIRVTGKGNIKVKPDMTRITITLEGCYADYGETLKKSTEDTEALKKLLKKYDFESSDVKTLSFNVDTKYESYQAYDKSWKQRFVGYEFRHVLKIEFDSDNDRLGKIMYSLANAEMIRPEFHLSYTVKDREASKNELLGKAVADAKAKAAVLTQASGVTLRDIQSIDYSWGEIDFEISPMRGNVLMDCCEDGEMLGKYEMDLEPDDIEVSDTVTVVWEIAS